MGKGDALVRYAKEPSVDLALQFLDGEEIKPGWPVQISRAKIDPSKFENSQGVSSKKFMQKKVAKIAMERALAWNEDIDDGREISILKKKKKNFLSYFFLLFLWSLCLRFIHIRVLFSPFKRIYFYDVFGYNPPLSPFLIGGLCIVVLKNMFERGQVDGEFYD